MEMVLRGFGLGWFGGRGGWAGKGNKTKKGHGDLGGGMACLLSLSSAGEEPERGQGGGDTHPLMLGGATNLAFM